MTSGTILPPDLVSTILARIRAGETQVAVAADLNLSRHTVSRYARIHGLARKRADPKPAGAPTLYRGKDLRWMGKAKCRGWFGFTEMTVREQLTVCKGLADTGPPCGVREECLAYGLTTAVGWAKADEGPVFGGRSPRQLAALQKQQRESVAS